MAEFSIMYDGINEDGYAFTNECDTADSFKEMEEILADLKSKGGRITNIEIEYDDNKYLSNEIDELIEALENEEPEYGNFVSLAQQIRAERKFDKEDLLEFFKIQDKITELHSELDEFIDMPTSKRKLYNDKEMEIREEISAWEKDLFYHDCYIWFECYNDKDMQEDIER